jgi:hypothetical protein
MYGMVVLLSPAREGLNDGSVVFAGLFRGFVAFVAFSPTARASSSTARASSSTARAFSSTTTAFGPTTTASSSTTRAFRSTATEY